MFVVIGKMYIKKEKIEKFQAGYSAVVESERKLDGCIVYQLFKVENASNIFMNLEQWESKAHFQKHLESEATKKALELFDECFEKESEMNDCELIK